MKTRNLSSDQVCEAYVRACIVAGSMVKPDSFYGRKVPANGGDYRRGTPGACRIFSEGRVLYSYGTHFVLAVHLPALGLFLVNADKYSVTTSSQQRDLHMALIGQKSVMVDGLRVDSDPSRILSDMVKGLDESRQALAKMTVGTRKAAKLYSSIQTQAAAIDRLRDLLGLPAEPAPALPPELVGPYAVQACSIALAA
jgi:hypothetical protein